MVVIEQHVSRMWMPLFQKLIQSIKRAHLKFSHCVWNWLLWIDIDILFYFQKVREVDWFFSFRLDDLFVILCFYMQMHTHFCEEENVKKWTNNWDDRDEDGNVDEIWAQKNAWMLLFIVTDYF